MSMAQACGQDVEVLDARTEWKTLYAQPDGQMRLESSIAAVRTKVSGDWTSVDTSLVAGPQGVTMVAPAVQMVFSNGAEGQPLARLVRDGHELTFDVPFDLPEPVVSDGILEYLGVTSGVDLLVAPDPDGSGFSEVLRVASPQAAADPRIRDLAFPVKVSDDLTLTSSNGGFVAKDAAGQRVFTSPAPAMWDSSTDLQTPRASANFGAAAADAGAGFGLVNGLQANRTARVRGPLDGDQRSMLESRLAVDEVAVAPDAGMLSDPDTVWPVYIDPDINASASEWVAISTAGWQHYKFSSDDGMGRCGTTGSPMYCSSVFTERLVYQFPGLGQITWVNPADISAATLSVFGTHSYSCTAYPVEAWWTGGISSGSNWNNVGWLGGQSSQTVAHKSACGNQRWIGFSVLGAAQQVAAQHTSQLSLGLKASDESSSTGWKRYRYDAQLVITYNQAPYTPSAPSIASPAKPCGSAVNTARPTFAVTLSDPDGGSVNGRFDIRDLRTGGTQTVPLPTVGSGTTVSAQPTSSLQDDNYSVTATAGDGSRLSGTSAACTFTVDTIAPNVAPGVSTVAGQPATYPEGQVGGGVGLSGQFTFTNGGVSDVASYKYAFDNSAMNLTATPGQLVTFASTSATVGPHVLYVQSVDRAGWVSPREDYRFSVAVTPTSGSWMFDDGSTSSIAADGAGSHPLALSSAALHTAGVLAEDNPDDLALHFGVLTDQAVSSGPLVSSHQSYTVGAFVRLDSLVEPQQDSIRTAVSQPGAQSPAFELGYRPVGDLKCPDGCWAFTVGTSDAANFDPIVVASDPGTAVVPDHWTYLAGVYNGVDHRAELYVCDPDVGEPQVTAKDFVAPAWLSPGALTVGRGQESGAPAHSLSGSVDQVRLLAGVADLTQIRRFCSPVA